MVGKLFKCKLLKYYFYIILKMDIIFNCFYYLKYVILKMVKIKI